MKLLCLSNGHGEDAIATRILQQLLHYPHPLELAALPLVGEGKAYHQLENLAILGPVQSMPSGGFIYMDGRQLLRDLKGGLVQLTLTQWQIVRAWANEGGSILAVGDIVPLLFAALSGADYAFVGTAKSEYYLRNEQGRLHRKSWVQRWEGWSGSVYLPWERRLMQHPRCQAVFPRDHLTTQILQQWSIPAFDLGNPMMDDLQPQALTSIVARIDAKHSPHPRSVAIALLPGSRPPEAYENWQLILQAVTQLTDVFGQGKSRILGNSGISVESAKPLIFLAAIAPTLDLNSFCQTLTSSGWQEIPKVQRSQFQVEPLEIQFESENATLILTQHGFNDCLHQADLAIAMAGTATEQFVGLGKPAIALPGHGPQFTPRFAEAQSRLLGPSLIVVDRPSEVPEVVRLLLLDSDRLQLIAENGKKRMGEPGAASRIAECLIERLKLW